MNFSRSRVFTNYFFAKHLFFTRLHPATKRMTRNTFLRMLDVYALMVFNVVYLWLQPVSCERPKISNLDELTTKTMAEKKSAAPNYASATLKSCLKLANVQDNCCCCFWKKIDVVKKGWNFPKKPTELHSFCFFLEDQGTQERQGKEVELSMDLLRKFPNYQDKNLTDKCCKALRLRSENEVISPGRRKFFPCNFVELCKRARIVCE